MKHLAAFVLVFSLPILSQAMPAFDCPQADSVGRLREWTVQVADRSVNQTGIASWYGPGLYGHRTSSGEVLTPATVGAAHKTLPMGTRILVTNLENGRSTCVEVKDRGPFVAGRIVDVTEKVRNALGMGGTTRVKLGNCAS